MSQSPSQYRRSAHVMAVLTALTALLPIALGAQTTTKNAGMAFRDWPTSDGENMLTYPWFSATGDKFLEHGHRLAGVLIGVASLALAYCLFFDPSRRYLRYLGIVAVWAVIVQGVLGGQRVLLDARGLAFIHGSTAALVFSFMWGIVVATSPGWFQFAKRQNGFANRDSATGDTDQSGSGGTDLPRWLPKLAIATYGCVYIQYVLGGLVRHHGQALYEHLAFAFVAALLVIVTCVAAGATDHPWLKRPALLAGIVTLCQLVLGAGTWITKFGYEDRVAVYGSTEQVAFRTLHVLTGMTLFASVSVLLFRILRLNWLASQSTVRATGSALLTSDSLDLVPAGPGDRK